MTKKPRTTTAEAKLSIMNSENAIQNIVHNTQDFLGNLTNHYKYSKSAVL